MPTAVASFVCASGATPHDDSPERFQIPCAPRAAPASASIADPAPSTVRHPSQCRSHPAFCRQRNGDRRAPLSPAPTSPPRFPPAMPGRASRDATRRRGQSAYFRTSSLLPTTQSSAFFRTPGTPCAYSGLDIRTASHASNAARNLVTASGALSPSRSGLKGGMSASPR